MSGRQGESSMPGEGCIRRRRGSGLEEGKISGTTAWIRSSQVEKGSLVNPGSDV